ncbi:phage GP46 family protein [Aeromonas hydrophila]|uniref:phage GP46 family protein n=1 Tax=Aeromonas TaxID=642 RepID=UPI0015DC0990|nr:MULTISPECIES: phage GP46 family protein [Aeromonas]BBQ24642.1 hypothetical protein WP2W18C05_08580 [Aeromonas sp. WP2-W18-CRE-05]HEB4993860.1 phage GP46 family protein [Aeromonas hydrophila subsp. hydrophila]HEB5046117.1 phage GP46 family protein [Aeromonas hydrophila subsp. hydrophila]
MLISINGVLTDSGDLVHPLHRAVFISLFTWRRAGASDDSDRPYGWWGDSYPTVAGDRIGSRLYLLQREKNLPKVRERARDYALEALAWLKDDELVTRIDAECRRREIDGAELVVTLTVDGSDQQITIPDILEAVNV